jgi:hypothetical protein
VRVRAAVVVALAAAAALGGGARAWAHPFGPPPTALLTVVEDAVVVEWRSAADDAAAIGVALGFMDVTVLDAYLEAPTQVAPSAADEEALAASTELRAYLLEHIAVRQDGVPCEGAVVDASDFVHGGATVVHRCPEPIRRVEVTLSMLHDVHEAYRTFAVTASDEADPAQAVFTVAEPVHVFDFSGSSGTGEAATPTTGSSAGGGGALALGALGAVLLVGLAGGLVLARRARS